MPPEDNPRDDYREVDEIPQFYSTMPDEDKLKFVVAIVRSMSPEYKQLVIHEIAGSGAAEETQVQVSSSENMVKIEFGHAMKWFVLPKEHALQLGASLMQHAGAVIQRVEREPGA